MARSKEAIADDVIEVYGQYVPATDRLKQPFQMERGERVEAVADVMRLNDRLDTLVNEWDDALIEEARESSA